MISGTWASSAIKAYRGLAALLEPISTPLLNYRQKRGKEDPSRRAERLGLSSRERPGGRLYWLHAASVGETNAVLPLVDRLVEADHSVILTTGTVTSAGVAQRHIDQEERSNALLHQFVPLDFPRAVDRFLDHWRPDMALFMESELWPVTMGSLKRKAIPLVIINARMSDRSWRRWNRFKPFARALLSFPDLVLAQSERDADRYSALGAGRVACTGNLKFDAPAPKADADRLDHYRRVLSGRPVLVAASTHEGEEDALFSAVKSIQSKAKDLVVLVAPRHPDRGEEVLRQANVSGLSAKLRSRGEELGEKQDRTDGQPTVYIADTIGELGLWYRLSDLAFVGGTLSERGGQNPIEPAKLGVPVIHGPNVWNFADIFSDLDGLKAAYPISDANELAMVISRLLSAPDERQQMAEASLRYVDTLTGATDRTLEAIRPLEGRGS